MSFRPDVVGDPDPLTVALERDEIAERVAFRRGVAQGRRQLSARHFAELLLGIAAGLVIGFVLASQALAS